MTQTTNRRQAPVEQESARVQPGTAIQLVKNVKPETLARWEQSGYPATKIALMQQQIAPTATLPELIYFIERCIAVRLDPFKRQIYFVKRRDGQSPTGFSCAHQVGIDGYRAIANDTGAYAGSDEPQFEGTIEIGGGVHAPALARVTVWKIVQGVRCAFVGVARWSEFYPGDRQGAMWRQMPHNQLAKCAEAQALRKGFPSELGELELAVEDRHRDGIGQFVDSAIASADGPQPQYLQLANGETVRAGDEYVRQMQEQYGDEVQVDPHPQRVNEPPAPEGEADKPLRGSRRAAEPESPVSERFAKGLCMHPECIEAETENQAAEGTDPPRCLNHVQDLPF